MIQRVHDFSMLRGSPGLGTAIRFYVLWHVMKNGNNKQRLNGTLI